MTFHVSSATFNTEGVELMFMELPGDVRAEGTLIQTRSIAIRDDSPTYGDEVTALRELATELVEEVAGDWATTPVYEPDISDDDDEEGMGS